MQKVKTFHHNHPVISTLIMVGLAAGLLAGGYSGYRYYQYLQTPDAKFDREAQSYKESWDEMMANAKQQTTLPKDEIPTLATITDKDSLDGQAFFKLAQNGDKIMIYKKSKVAYLYRPSEKRIISQAKLDYKEPTPIPFEAAAVAGTSSAEPEDITSSASAEQAALDKLLPQ